MLSPLRFRVNPVRHLTVLSLMGIIWHSVIARGAEIETTEQLLLKGKYEEALAASQTELTISPGDADWARLAGAALTAVGRYTEAREFLASAVTQNPLDLRLRLAAYEAALVIGKSDVAKVELTQMQQLGEMREWAYRKPVDRVALGKMALLIGGDPKKVLELFFDPVRKEAPELRDSYLASGKLALDKNDYSLASKNYAAAVKKFPEDADAWYGLARAYAPTDVEESVAALQKSLAFNPGHTAAQVLLAEHRIDAEDYEQADAALAEVLKINPHLPEAHALRAVLANLRADAKAEKAARAEALKFWPSNPRVPHLIGRKLSQKYRFAEGAALQGEALKFDPNYLPAKGQLANDLLRLGDDDHGWKLAEEVQKADPYDVVAYNLVTLRDAIRNFRILSSEHFNVRMDPREADIYGSDVLALLERAYATLTRKYGLPLRDKTIVEIFPDQKDFAIRTFGLPGGSGYLGVCFGRVITANSPASRPNSPNSWEAVLWHEFCHVVTLTLTKNKMPRWLSEGISVYEERQSRKSWGEQMKPRYRMMILGEDLTPVSQLSGAFLRPKTAAHLGFAYYESSLVVEWLIERWGLEKMKKVLADLAQGAEINASLAANFAPVEQLDTEFADHAKALARNVAPKLDWTQPTRADVGSASALEKFIESNPNNYEALRAKAQKLIGERKWKEAKEPLQRLIELYPDQREGDSGYAMLARVQRELGEIDAEVATLTTLTDLVSDVPDAFLRLMEIYSKRNDWPNVIDHAARYAAVDPLRPEPHRYEAIAYEAQGDKSKAIGAYRTLLKLDPPDFPDVHYRLARLLHATGDSEAKRHIILALEETPRFRDAYELLLRIVERDGSVR
jgi:tetratricopeptide (TPR) repeat protein